MDTTKELDIYTALKLLEDGNTYPIEVRQLAQWTRVFPYKVYIDLLDSTEYHQHKDYKVLNTLGRIYGGSKVTHYWLTLDTALDLCMECLTLESGKVYSILKEAQKKVTK